MNRLTIQDPKILNNKKISFFIPASVEMMKDQVWEIFGQEQYKKGLIKKNMTIIDCGANVGLASIYFKDWAKVIYALEPNPKNYECLVANTRQFKNIKTFNIGLAARAGKEILRNNGDYPVGESLFGEGEVKDEVNLYSIKEFMDDQGIDHVDLLKMDTEGAEYIIFPSDGFEQVAGKIDAIVGEAHYLHKLIPEYIPLILDEFGFKTEFLPIDNIFVTMTFMDRIEKEYKVQKQTLFFSERKKK